MSAALAGIDWVVAAVWIALTGMVLTTVGALILGWNATVSRNLVLACAALVGAMVFSVIQAGLELRSQRARDLVGGGFVFDPATTTIHHVPGRGPVTRSPSERMSISLRTIPEESANALLASLRPRPALNSVAPEAFHQRIKILTDFALFSLLHYIKLRQPDWQARYTMVEAPFMAASVVQPSPSFTTRNCTDLGVEQLQALLRESRNTFATASLAEFATNPLCLPPKSTMSIDTDSLMVRNPFLDLRFRVRFQAGGAGIMLFNFDVVTVYSALRAQHSAMPDYRDWVQRLIADARPWFGASGGANTVP